MSAPGFTERGHAAPNAPRRRWQRSPGPNPWERMAQALKFGGSITPINLWAVTDSWRNAPPVPPENIE